ncbi:DUF6101 family protein [Rhodoblastus sp.]|uniref:DUF6101 family protein n=1 Tax=Rhodoblastus sp. TaxID=1962975 RepID=UPI0025F4A7BA|nr:DUF6101 family protein [Rhodoblastus sp.]
MVMSPAAPMTRLVAADPRADNGQREISISAEAIAIDRRVGGVKMRFCLPAPSFRGVALSVYEAARGFVYRVALVHADPELDVVLAESENEADISRDWLCWAKFFRLPRLTRRAGGGEAVIDRRFGEVEAGEVMPRRRGWPLKGRRSMISARRLCGAKGRVVAVHRGEREIVCYE